MSAAIIEFPRRQVQRPKKNIVITPLGAAFWVRVQPEETDAERAFAQCFLKYADARAWGDELVATWGNIFGRVEDRSRADGAA